MTTLLIDGDIVAYQAASACEHPVHWGDDLWTLHSFADEAINYAENMIDRLVDEAGCSEHIILLSKGRVFRLDIDPEYKANRVGKRKPVCLPQVRDSMRKFLRSKSVDGLEADDLIGILATSYPDKYVIWSPDKDLRQIAGQHLIDGEVVTINQDEADRAFWMQCLTGDTADNYKGCVGVGPVKAARILDEDNGLSTWQKIVAAYEKAGMSVEDALATARLAHILTYDTKDSLWSPTND